MSTGDSRAFRFLTKLGQNDILSPLDVYPGSEKTVAFAGMTVAAPSAFVYSESLRQLSLRILKPALLFTLLILADFSWGQSNDHLENCAAEAEGGHFDLAIDVCTAAIQSEQLSDEDLAVTFNNPGTRLLQKKALRSRHSGL
jgi:hypothetical protein